MDEAHPLTAPTLRFAPDLRLTALIAGAMLIAVGLAATADDAISRAVWIGAALVLAAYAAGDVIFRPRLTADATGLRIRSPLARASLAWPEIEDVRADVRSRLGLRSVTLEVDAGETLVVFSRRALGADPEAVQELVRAMQPR